MHETFGELLRSGPHWLFELTVVVVTALVLAPVAGRLWRAALRRHAEAHAIQGQRVDFMVMDDPCGDGKVRPGEMDR